MDGDEAPSSPKKKKVEISADKCIKCMRSGGKKAITDIGYIEKGVRLCQGKVRL